MDNNILHGIIYNMGYDFTLNWALISIITNVILFWSASNWLIPSRLLKERKLNKLMDFQYEIKKYLYILHSQLHHQDGRMIKKYSPFNKDSTNEIANVIESRCNGITGGLIPTYSEWIDMEPILKDALILSKNFFKITIQMRNSCEEKILKPHDIIECEHIKNGIDSMLSKIQKLKIK